MTGSYDHMLWMIGDGSDLFTGADVTGDGLRDIQDVIRMLSIMTGKNVSVSPDGDLLRQTTAVPFSRAVYLIHQLSND